MIIDAPSRHNIPQLRSLWKEAFGDTDAFLNLFWEKAYSPSRCRCVLEEGRVVAALYWFDCLCRGKKLAYIYAVATATSHRGKGLCAALMDATHAHLKANGYSGTILVPAGEDLFRYYAKLGYRTCCHADRFTCAAGEKLLPLRRVSPEEYASLRRKLLQEGGVLQEQENLTFLQTLTHFYGAENLLFAANIENGQLHAMEFLGDPILCPAVVHSLGCSQGHFRIPGNSQPFAMYFPLDSATAPTWFGLPFD